MGLEGRKDGKLLVVGGDSGQKPSVAIRKMSNWTLSEECACACLVWRQN